MEVSTEKAREYILALKTTGNFSYEDIANQSGIPLQTVRNILSGKTPDARFGTITRLVTALGGSLDELVGYEKKKEIEVNSMVSLKETYEMRIADIIKLYEERIEDLKTLCELRISDVQKCYETRISDIKQNFEERLAEQKELFKNNMAVK